MPDEDDAITTSERVPLSSSASSLDLISGRSGALCEESGQRSNDRRGASSPTDLLHKVYFS